MHHRDKSPGNTILTQIYICLGNVVCRQTGKQIFDAHDFPFIITVYYRGIYCCADYCAGGLCDRSIPCASFGVSRSGLASEKIRADSITVMDIEWSYCNQKWA